MFYTSASCCLSWSECRSAIGEQAREKNTLSLKNVHEVGRRFFLIQAEALLCQLIPVAFHPPVMHHHEEAVWKAVVSIQDVEAGTGNLWVT